MAVLWVGNDFGTSVAGGDASVGEKDSIQGGVSSCVAWKKKKKKPVVCKKNLCFFICTLQGGTLVRACPGLQGDVDGSDWLLLLHPFGTLFGVHIHF